MAILLKSPKISSSPCTDDEPQENELLCDLRLDIDNLRGDILGICKRDAVKVRDSLRFNFVVVEANLF
jgi:hypothetical protein